MQKKNMNIGLDILMCCHGHHAQPLQPVASAHLWGLLGIPLCRRCLNEARTRGALLDMGGMISDPKCWMLLAGHHMEPPNRTGTTLK